MSDRRGRYIYTYSGVLFYPLDPRVEEVRIDDIVQGLSLKCRWTGQCNRFYSVATHSIRVGYIAKFLAEQSGRRGPELDLPFKLGVLHDAHEAYLADIASPIKKYIQGWQEHERRVQDTIDEFIGVAAPKQDDPEAETFVHWADLMLLLIEHRDLFNNPLEPDALFHYPQVELWPGYPEISGAVEAVANIFTPLDAREELKCFLHAFRSEVH